VSGARVPSFVAAAALAVLFAFAGAAASRAESGATAGEAAIFYYPWYSTPVRDGRWAHWYVEEENGTPVLSTPYFPSRGLYSSSNVKVVGAHMREISAAGVGTVIASWWGKGSQEDDRLPLVIRAAREHGLDVAIHIEPYPGRSPESVADDIAAFSDVGMTDFYVYDADRDPASDWAEALAEVDGVRVFGHTTLVGRAKVSGFDGLYTYDVVSWNGSLFRRLCTQAHRAGLLCAPSVGPGFDARLATGHETVRARLHGATYDRMWKTALRADADLVTITSYNEWQEGTQIEPAQTQFGRPSYDGAWGKRGPAAQRAYLAATAYWTVQLAASSRQ
jgi:glycoprotein endo-alpha-1,2-mannosidase